MNSRCSRASSKVWKTFSPLKELLQLGIKWHVGDGMNIQAWTDSWIPQTPQPLPLLDKPVDCDSTVVADFLHNESRQWNRALVLDKWPLEYAL
ncbi:hypothetical protein FRX31_022567, partial [Thalictrum thalictroides]